MKFKSPQKWGLFFLHKVMNALSSVNHLDFLN